MALRKTQRTTDLARAGTIQSVRRALLLLKTFGPSRPELGVNELARMHGLHPSSVSRLLATLAEAGLVRADPETRRYRLGLGILELAAVLLRDFDVRSAAQPVMRDLSRLVQETVNLSVLDGAEAVIIDQVAAPSGVAFVSWIGRRTPVHATSHGKLLLAYLAEPRQDEVLGTITDRSGRLPKITERTIDTVKELVDEMALIRRRGYATARGEFHPDTSGVSAPIFGPTGEVAAALVVAGPSFRVSQRRQMELAPTVIETAAGISREIGWVSRADANPTERGAG